MAGLLLYFGVAGARTFNMDGANDSGRSGDQPTTTSFTNSTNQTETHTTHGGDGANYVLNPFKTVLFIAGFMLVNSFLGLYAAFSYRGKKTPCKCTLFLDIVFKFVGVCTVVYGAIFVLVFADDADEMIVIFWKFTQNTLPSPMSQSQAVSWFHQHLSGAAGVLLFCSVLLMICILCDSHLLGHDLTARRIVITTNVGTFILGILLIVVAAMNDAMFGKHEQILLPFIAGGGGGLTLLVSAIGIFSVWDKHRPRLLCCYSLSMFTLTTCLVTIAVLGFQRRDEVKQFVNEHWTDFENKVIGARISKDDFVRTLHQHLNLIGLSSSILACTLFLNTGAACRFWCSRRMKRKYDDDYERRNMLSDSEEELSDEDAYDDYDDVDVHHDDDDEEQQQSTQRVEMTEHKSTRGKKAKRKKHHQPMSL